MSEWIGTLQLAMLAALGFALTTSLLAAPVYPLLRKALRQAHPVVRARAAFGAATVPLALPGILVALCFVPGILSGLGLHADHCLQHGEHFHLCFAHAAAPPTPFLSGLLLLVLAGAALALALVVRFLFRSRRLLNDLALGAHGVLGPDQRLLESDAAFCLTAGLWRPRTYLSTALARALSPAQLEVVIAHERAHARRRDALRHLLARALCCAHLPWIRERILADLELACEQACDEEAGRRVGDRLRVAETILAAERLLAAESWRRGPSALAFGQSAVPERTRSLLREPARPPSRLLALCSGLLLLALGLAVADPLHHLTEHLLDLFVH